MAFQNRINNLCIHHATIYIIYFSDLQAIHRHLQPDHAMTTCFFHIIQDEKRTTHEFSRCTGIRIPYLNDGRTSKKARTAAEEVEKKHVGKCNFIVQALLFLTGSQEGQLVPIVSAKPPTKARENKRMLLEEALNGLIGDPADICRAFHLFLKEEYAVGGVDAEYRFHQKLYPLLLKSIFGPLEITTEADERKSFCCRHLSGGWLSRTNRWNVVPQKNQQQPQHTNDYLLSIDPVVVLLSPPPLATPTVTSKRIGRSMVSGTSETMNASHSSPISSTLFAPSISKVGGRKQQTRSESNVDTNNRNVLSLILKTYGNYFEHPFLALTQGSQHTLMALVRRHYFQEQHQQQQQILMGDSNTIVSFDDIFMEDASDNEVTLYSKLLQVKPIEQRGLVELFQMIAFGPPTPTTLMHESSPRQRQQQQQHKFQTLVEQKRSTTTIFLSAWEKFFFLFLFFPLAKPASTITSTPAKSASIITSKTILQQTPQRLVEPYGDLVYSHLFKLYVNYFFPTSSLDDFHAYTDNFSTHSELFIRLIIDFWISNGIVLTQVASDVPGTAQEKPTQVDTLTLSNMYDNVPWAFCEVPLPSSALHQLNYPTMILKCRQYLILHLCSDPFLEQSGSWCIDKEHDYANKDNLLYDVLSPPLILLQPHMYKFIQTSFRRAPLVVQSKANTSPSHFNAAIDLWLTWLEPWNSSCKSTTAVKILTHITPHGHKQNPITITTIIPKPTANSKFSEKWQFYIASNAHIYITLFAVFLRRARELDFSQQSFKRSIDLLLSVTRVFSKEVCEVLSRAFSSSMSSLLKQLRVEHEKNLRHSTMKECAIFPTSVSLNDCKVDALALLEEIYFQHFKRKREMNVIERLDDKIEWMAGSGGSKHELQLIDRFKNQLCSIVGLPEYRYSGSKEQNESRGYSARHVPQTESNGITLTMKGREEILRGKKIFAPTDVKYLGDPMKARVRSYEIGFMVHWCVWTSCWINSKLGLDRSSSMVAIGTPSSVLNLIEETEKSQKIWFRINLRFLADYRNLIFFSLLVILYKLVRCFFLK